MLTGAFLCLPYGGMPEADSLKHPQQFYLTLPLQQTVFARYGNSHIGMNSVHLARLSVQFFPFCELPLHAAGAASGKRIHVLKDEDVKCLSWSSHIF
ncbi:hypothetical protein C9Z37_25255 [Escherichia coli]|nr:hypothetical protein C9Z37_25255 [Escherichia coli]